MNANVTLIKALQPTHIPRQQQNHQYKTGRDADEVRHGKAVVPTHYFIEKEI